VLAPTSLFSTHDFPVLPPSPRLMRIARLSPWIARAFMAIIRRATASWTMPVRALRAELGLADTGSPMLEGQFSPRGTLALFSPIFGPPQVDWPVNTTATGFVFHDELPVPADVSRFLDAGDAPIVFTLGSSASNAAGTFYDESARAATSIGKRALLLVGRDPRNRPAMPWPNAVLAAEYAPHAYVFPRAAVVVHHGGVGTTGQGLRSGRPTLVVPHSHDQPDNAFRCRNLGVAAVIEARDYRGPHLATTLRTLCDDARYAVRAAAVGEGIRAEDGVGAACARILHALG
jgi:UDP:flavonoid glycosyltransferase YjiC (YdhE family)